MLVSTALRLGDITYSHARDMNRNSHSEGTCVLLETPSMHKLVQYFQTLHRNVDIYELKGVHIATFEP